MFLFFSGEFTPPFTTTHNRIFQVVFFKYQIVRPFEISTSKYSTGIAGKVEK